MKLHRLALLLLIPFLASCNTHCDVHTWDFPENTQKYYWGMTKSLIKHQATFDDPDSGVVELHCDNCKDTKTIENCNIRDSAFQQKVIGQYKDYSTGKVQNEDMYVSRAVDCFYCNSLYKKAGESSLFYFNCNSYFNYDSDIKGINNIPNKKQHFKFIVITEEDKSWTEERVSFDFRNSDLSTKLSMTSYMVIGQAFFNIYGYQSIETYNTETDFDKEFFFSINNKIDHSPGIIRYLSNAILFGIKFID